MGQQLHILQGHTNRITSVAFSPDGTTVLTGSFDYTARLWDIKTRLQLGELVTTVEAFSDDCTSILPGPPLSSGLWTRVKISKENSSEEEFELPALSTGVIVMAEGDSTSNTGTTKEITLEEISDTGKVAEESPVLGFTQAINLEDDSQKECSIQ